MEIQMSSSYSKAIGYFSAQDSPNKMSTPIYPSLDEGHITLDDKQMQRMFYEDRYNLMTQKKEELTANVKRYLRSKSHYH